MKKTLAVTVLLFCSFFVFSQSRSYEPGLVVSDKGDTLKGWIDYGNWQTNPRKIRFKADSAGSPVVKSIEDLSYFEITGKDAYRKAVVTKDMRPILLANITSDTRDSLETDTVFLRVLVAGKKCSLYQLSDSKVHYYLQEPGGEPTELGYKVYLDETGTQAMQLYSFRDDLKRIAVGNNQPDLLRDIDRARYTEKNLSRIVMALNGRVPAVVYGQANKKNSSGPQFFASAGVNDTHFTTSGDNGFALVGMNFKEGVSPVFALGVDLLSGRNFNDFTFRFEVAYAQSTYSGQKSGPSPYNGSASHETYELEQRNITPAISVLYNFRRTKKTRFYVGAGVAYNFSGYGTNRYVYTDNTGNYPDASTDNYLVLKKSWGSLFLRLGVRINSNWEIGASATFLGSFINYQVFEGKPTVYSLRLSRFLFAHR